VVDGYEANVAPLNFHGLKFHESGLPNKKIAGEVDG